MVLPGSTAGRVAGAVNQARRAAWARAEARHGALPGVRVADKVLDGVACIRLDATVVAAHSNSKGAEPNFKGLATIRCWRTDTIRASRWPGFSARGRPGATPPTTISRYWIRRSRALPPKHRRRLMVTVDGAGASHDPVKHLDKLAAGPGYQLICPVGWELGERERQAIAKVPGEAW
jgi:hypothetical protein